MPAERRTLVVRREPAAWTALAALGFAVAGLAVSIYLTAEHYTTPTLLACPETGVVNCQKVTSSPQSIVLGVPVAVWGVGYFVAMVALTLPWAWRNHHPLLRRSRLALAAIGVASVVYLVGVELFAVDAICLWCTAVHVITLALFAVIVFRAAIDEG
jgi:uncharacterized membrane protein